MTTTIATSNKDTNNNDNSSEEDYKPGENSDHGVQIVATAIAHRLIPTNKRQRGSSVLQSYTNAPDPPKYNLLHKGQQPVTANGPWFHKALEKIIIPPKMMFLYQHCLAKSKDSLIISAIAHIQVISKGYGLCQHKK